MVKQLRVLNTAVRCLIIHKGQRMRFLEFKPLNENIGTLEIPVPGPYRSKIVSAMQTALAALNYDVHDTSIVDERTMKAIAAAQQNFGLPVTGKPDSNFISALNMSIPSIPGLSDYIANAMKSAKADSDKVASAVAGITGGVLGARSNPSTTPTDGTSAGSNPSTTPSVGTGAVGTGAVAATKTNTKIKPIKSKSPLATDPEFLAKVKEVADKLSVDPHHLLKIMQYESGLDPSRPNQQAKREHRRGAIGLIQFMPKTAAALGTTTEKLAAMSGVEQMDYVLAYYKMVQLKPNSTVADMYLRTFMPASTNMPANTVLGRKGVHQLIPGTKDQYTDKVYHGNSGFDKQGKGYFTKADVENAILSA